MERCAPSREMRPLWRACPLKCVGMSPKYPLPVGALITCVGGWSFIGMRVIGQGIPSMSSVSGVCPVKVRGRNTAPQCNEFDVVAMYDYPGLERGDLALIKGQKVTVFDDTREYWWRARDDKG